MKILIWNSSANYRSFISTDEGRYSLISSNISDEVDGLVMEDKLVIVSDLIGYFCDIEFIYGDSVVFTDIGPVSSYVDSEECIYAVVDSDREVRIIYDGDLGVAQIWFGDGVDKWVRVMDGNVIIGLDLEGVLTCIHCNSVNLDQDGSLEESWVEDINRGRLI